MKRQIFYFMIMKRNKTRLEYIRQVQIEVYAMYRFKKKKELLDQVQGQV